MNGPIVRKLDDQEKRLTEIWWILVFLPCQWIFAQPITAIVKDLSHPWSLKSDEITI